MRWRFSRRTGASIAMRCSPRNHHEDPCDHLSTIRTIPPGGCSARRELETCGIAGIEHDLIVISDEVWEHVAARRRTFHASRDPSRTWRSGQCKVGSAGKIFSLTGWKVGWIVASPISRNGGRPGAPVPDVLHCTKPAGGGRLWTRRGRCWIQPMRDRFRRSRDLMTEGLRSAGYAVLDAERLISSASTCEASGIPLDDESFALAAVEQAGVAVVPLSAFAERDPPQASRSPLLRQKGRDD